LAVALGHLYMQADDGTHGKEPWKCNTAGTCNLVMDIHNTGASNPSGFTEFNNEVWFVASSVAGGSEPWRCDVNDNCNEVEV